MLTVLLPLVLVSVALAGDTTYDYSDPDTVWTGTCATGRSQSPIDVITPTNTKVWRENKGYTFGMPSDVNSTFQYKSHTVFYAISDNDKHYVEDPTQEDTSCLIHQLHFHWGDNATLGAEHHMDGHSYSAEIHLVTQRQGVDSEYVVFNRFLEEGHDDNEELGKLLDETDVDDLDLSKLYPDSIEYILTYSGSLTTPTCDEVVTWVIIPEPLKISTEQGNTLRAWTYNGATIGDTHRPIQPLNGRTIYGVKFTEDDDSDDDDSDDDNNMVNGECARGYFNWEGFCNKCPPGQSTVDTGASYWDCIATRYITCNWDAGNSKMWCERNYCPCTYMEDCSEGQCYTKTSSALTVTGSMLLALLAILCTMF